ncbi:ATP-dependent DNA helicase RuvA [Candidatus Formimonas warabiya]|uniref:ATP-dependent DNA helicase RuvA n=2 Tax=Formimonas warabiya TaxID=1761012 RepID=A0A3G1L2K3_FORW1|nr:ATP-dependent DNA helicase RuvA [Candidatus Formimonas warabiya]
MTVTDKERKIIELIRSTGFGELKIVIQDQEPVRIEEITKSIKL